jgi:hypothetical protein
MIEPELREIIENGLGEHAVMNYLAKHPSVVRWAFSKTGGHSAFVLKEFPFGCRYRADFVVLTSRSGAWEIQMIEFEPPNDRVINKDGTPSQRFNKAISQIHDWKSYIEKNPIQIRQDLSDWCVKKDILGFFSDDEPPCSDAGDYLHDPNTCIWYHYHIVIGRRDKISKEQRRKMNQYYATPADVHTYGLILDIAANFDIHNANPHKSILLTETKE